MKYQNLYHVIDISCNTCEKHPTVDLFSLDYGYRPFIVVNTTSSQTIKRQRRSINCSPGVSECCRDKLYISFAEIGWNDWILHPAGYDAYFCRGSCASAATITSEASNYHLFVRVSFQCCCPVRLHFLLCFRSFSPTHLLTHSHSALSPVQFFFFFLDLMLTHLVFILNSASECAIFFFFRFNPLLWLFLAVAIVF